MVQAAAMTPFYAQPLRDEIRPLTYNHYLQAYEYKRQDDYKPRFFTYFNDLQLISHRAYFMTTWLSQKLVRQGDRPEFYWVLHSERHFFTRSVGRALRRQFNIAVTIGDTPEEDVVRVGLGIVFHSADAQDRALGMQDWGDLWVAVNTDHGRFDRLFAQHLGGLGYAEVRQEQAMPIMPITAQQLLAYQPDRNDDWVFIGRRFRWGDPNDAAILNNRDRFAEVCHEIFQRIRAAGYAPGL